MLALVNTYVVHTASLLNDFSLKTESRLLEIRSKCAATKSQLDHRYFTAQDEPQLRSWVTLSEV